MAEPPFIPKPGQVDYTHIRYAPCLNIVVTHQAKILMVKRADDMRLYPGRWAVTIGGFLDDDQSIEDKVLEELDEELGIKAGHIESLTRGTPIIREAPDHAKTWLIVPVLARVKTSDFKLSWEASDAQWVRPQAIKKFDVLPGVLEFISQFFPEVLGPMPGRA